MDKCKNDNQKKLGLNLSELGNVEIEFGAIGLGSHRPTIVFEIEMDSVKILNFNHDSNSKIQLLKIQTKETIFQELLSVFDEKDLTNNINYVYPVVDGGFMRFSSKYGEKTFNNTFVDLTEGEKLLITPDTIGLSNFENINNYAFELLKSLEMKGLLKSDY